MTIQNPNELLTLKEAAEALRMKYTTFCKILIKGGKLKYFKATDSGKIKMVTRGEIDRYISENIFVDNPTK